jgi:hypothetical protein
MTDAQGNIVLPGFQEYTGTHTMNIQKQSSLANPNTPTTEIMGNLETADLKKIFIIKSRLLGKSNVRRTSSAFPAST